MDTIIKQICIDCGKPFEMTEEHVQWFKDRDMFVPRRCLSCRNNRRFIDAAMLPQPPEQKNIKVTSVPELTLKAEPVRPAHFYAIPLPKGALATHKNAKYHIFNAKGTSYCGAYNSKKHFYSGVILEGRFPEDAEQNLCNTCKEAFKNAGR